MKSLDRYARHFDKAYPKYHDDRYGDVLKLVEGYGAPGVEAHVKGPDFAKVASLIEPLTAVKNYKSQVPYPRDVASAVSCIFELRRTAVTTKDVLSRHEHAMARLLEIEGFHLPTVSAVLHFCHPRHFPIVDVNVQAACALLRKRHRLDFEMVKVPKLPGPQAPPGNQIKQYGDGTLGKPNVREYGE